MLVGAETGRPRRNDDADEDDDGAGGGRDDVRRRLRQRRHRADAADVAAQKGRRQRLQVRRAGYGL